MSAFWSVGFRPFFTLVMLSGAALPLSWALIYSGLLGAPFGDFSPTQWHAHEMFFGFAWALLAGFLLTASKNWVGIRGYHGRWLQFLFVAWFAERLGMWFGASLPAPLFWASNLTFLTSAIALLCWTLYRYRERDSYRDNYFFLLALPLFVPAKLLLLDGATMSLGIAMTLGLFRLAFLIMLERTLTQFMKALFGVVILRSTRLDLAIKLLALALVFEGLMPDMLAGGLSLLLFLLLAARFFFWHPRLAFSRLDVGIMYLGYLGIMAHLALAGLAHWIALSWTGSLVPHVFSFGVIGLIAPAMIVRISKGHTGRKVVFEAWDKAALWAMILAFAARVLLSQLLPSLYALWIDLAALCWFATFSTLGWRYIPFLLQPRADGKAF